MDMQTEEKCMIGEIPEEIFHAKCEELFVMFDEDKNNLLDREEIKKAYQMWGINLTDAELTQEMRLFDYDENGLIDLEEFKTLMKKMAEENKREQDVKTMRDAFRKVARGRKHLNKKLFTKILKQTGESFTEDEVECLFEKIDTNKNGTIEIEEFVTAFTSEGVDIAGCLQQEKSDPGTDVQQTID